MLSDIDFKNLVASGILTGIDFIIVNERDEILVGKRLNKPAQGFWFVPGGRIYKNETIPVAMKRIFRNEMAIEIGDNSANFIGVFEHIYDDNYLGDPGFNTHYIMLCFKIKINKQEEESLILKQQHSQMKWLTKKDLMLNPLVHVNVKHYFEDKPVNGIRSNGKE